MKEERTTAVTVRPATDADLPRIERLLARGKLLSAGSVAHANGILVAEVGSELAGVVGLEMVGGDGLLRAASVGAEGRGRDVGRLLIEGILTEAALQAADAIYLFTDGSDRFFARFGFSVLASDDVPPAVRAWAESHGGVPDGAIAMRLPLVES